jgi:L-2-hydroxycarboxylate dehydrogenase (NAD+)
MVDPLRERTYGQWWEADEEYVEVAVDAVAATGAAAYRAVGATAEDAEYLFSFNLEKALQGDHARGVRLARSIVEAVQSGRMDLSAPIEVVSDRPAAAVVDGGRKASPRLVCRRAMQLAVEKAATQGVGWVSARAHGEILTPYVRQAVDAGMVGVVFVQSVPNVAVLGGHGPLLGNAPLAIGVPAGRYDPVILDLSLTQSSASGVGMTAAQGGTVPPGVLLDADGQPTDQAEAFVLRDAEGRVVLGSSQPRGTLAVLGGGHKGWALVFIVGLLAAVLSDTSPPWELYYDLAERGTYGTVMLALDPSVAMPAEAFSSKVDEFIDGVKTRGGAPDVLYPGERSQALRRERRDANRMALPLPDYETLVWLAELGGVEVPTAS